jgi:4'-phosphopantetheinyl transferase
VAPEFIPFSLPYGVLERPSEQAVDVWLLPLNELSPPLTLSLQEDANPTSVAALRLTRKMMLRLLLAAYVGVSPRELKLSRSSSGKPRISAPLNTGLVYSVSYSLDFMLVAVACQGRLGIDLEPLSRWVKQPMKLARRYLAPAEQEALAAIDNEGQRRRDFLRLWTRKEALVKATGGGIVSGLDRFTVVDSDDQPQITAMQGEDPAQWHLRHIEPQAGLVGTVASDFPIQQLRTRRVAPPGAVAASE